MIVIEARRSKDTLPSRRGAFDSPSYAQLNPDTAIFGRETQIYKLSALLVSGKHRLITLTGPGGVGKTRIAMAAIEKMRAEQPEVRQNSAVVSLDTLRNPDLILSAVAKNLRLDNDEGRLPVEALVTRLRDDPFLLYLDNFEHLLDAAPTITSLLLECPRLTILTTSRVPLHLRIEWPIEVEPLELPSDDQITDIYRLGTNPSVAMFVERSKGNIALTEENAKAIAEICRRLDGLPLALELAAARSGYFQSAHALLAGLARALDVLIQGERDAPDRQQSLRATIGWSYGLLSEEEQALFRALGVFREASSLEVIEGVAHCVVPKSRIKPGLDSLVDHRLVRVFAGSEGQPLYTMLETIRAYCEELFEQSEWRATLEWSHAEYYLSFVESITPPPKRGGFGDRIHHDGPGLRSAVRWLLEEDDPEKATRLLSATFHTFWRHPDNRLEGKGWITKVLRHPKMTDESMVEARRVASRFADYTDDFLYARELLDANLARALERGDDAAIGNALLQMSHHAIEAAGLDEVWEFANRALEARVRSGDMAGAAEILADLAWVSATRGDLTAARENSSRAVRLLTNNKKAHPLASLNCFIAPALGSYTLLRGYKKHEDGSILPIGILDLGQETEIPYILGLFCVLAIQENPPEVAAQVYGALHRFLAASEMAWIGGESGEGEVINKLIALSRQALGESEWSRQAANGSTFPLVEAFRLAVGKTVFNDGTTLERLDVSPRPRRTETSTGPSVHRYYFEGLKKPLTDRDLMVLQGVIDGKPRKEIGAELHIKERGVDYYTNKIYERILESGDEALIESATSKKGLFVAFAKKHNIAR